MLIKVVDMIIRDIGERTATRVNFLPPPFPAGTTEGPKHEPPRVPPQPPPSSSAEHHGEEQTTQGFSLIPLPVSTPAFRSARFFLVSDEQKKKLLPDGDAVHLVINLDTENLGQLWFNIIAGQDSLYIRCLTESDQASRLIRDSFPSLESALGELSYRQITLTSAFHRDGVLSEQPLQPAGENSLIDIKV